jgi:CobQ/CobB/MinD/ParA nucleotide binding domain
MQKKFNTIINGKGGVGKSFFAVNFVQFLKDHQIAHTAVDTDNENSTLKRFHPEALFLDIEDPTEIDSVFATLDKADLVVMDCRAASTDIFLDYFEEVRIFDLLQSVGASLNLIMPVNHETDSLEQIRSISERLNHNAQYLVVKNQALSDRFANYERSATRTRLLGELAGKEIVMPKLYDWIVADLNRHNLTVSIATKSSEFDFFNRGRLQNWQHQFYDELESVRGMLLPPPRKAQKPKVESKSADSFL